MLSSLVDSVIDYCSKDDTKQAIEDRLMRPAFEYLTERFQWTSRLVHTLVVMVAVQTVLLLWVVLLLRKRYAV